MCQLWALHVVIKRQFFNIDICSFLLNLFCVCMLLHKPIYGFVKQTEAVLKYYFWLWPPYVIGGIIFLPCSFFLLSFFLSSFFSSPNLSGRRLDVYHTSTHGVALVRI